MGLDHPAVNPIFDKAEHEMGEMTRDIYVHTVGSLDGQSAGPSFGT